MVFLKIKVNACILHPISIYIFFGGIKLKYTILFYFYNFPSQRPTVVHFSLYRILFLTHFYFIFGGYVYNIFFMKDIFLSYNHESHDAKFTLTKPRK